VKGHARAAEPGFSTIHRRLFYNPDGSGRAGEFDFITYFECADEHVATFDRIRASRRTAEPGVALRRRRAGVAGQAGPEVVTAGPSAEADGHGGAGSSTLG
jgi:hypothetical protein